MMKLAKRLISILWKENKSKPKLKINITECGLSLNQFVRTVLYRSPQTKLLIEIEDLNDQTPLEINENEIISNSTARIIS